MTDCPTPRPHLSATRLSMLSRCGLQYEYRYVKNLIEPPNVAMLKGRAVHRVAEMTLRRKMRTGAPCPHEEVADYAAMAIGEELCCDYRLSPDEHDAGVDATRARAIDSTLALALTYNLRLAPILQPTHVERPFCLELPYSHDLTGVIDVQEANAIRDLKTGGTQPDPHASLQLTVYALAHRVLEGSTPSVVSFDHLADEGICTHTRLNSTRSRSHFEALMHRIEAACRVLAAGAFVPADPSSWACSPRWCGYWDRCPQGMAHRTVVA